MFIPRQLTVQELSGKYHTNKEVDLSNIKLNELTQVVFIESLRRHKDYQFAVSLSDSYKRRYFDVVLKVTDSEVVFKDASIKIDSIINIYQSSYD